jgi:hypothetical protein
MLSLSRDNSQSLPGIAISRHVSEDALSDETMDLAREWLEECTTSHPACEQRQDSRLPTRVINVEVNGKDPRLYVTHNERGRYATLSHCWGQVPILTTTNSNLDDMKASIPLKQMPKTFREAVIVTRRLGLKFLWIDSLCILQDSKEDWMREASRMGDIYACAAMNISADAGTDPNAGLNKSRLMVGTEIGVSEPGVSIYTRPFPKAVDPYAVIHKPSRHDQRNHILDTRGWVLQERLLSPRILHFGEHEIGWECDTAIRCECSLRSREPSARLFRNVTKTCPRDHSYGEAWRHLVHTYVPLDFTFESDRLAAISGLVSRAAKCWSMTYINGLWKEHFPWSLYWRAFDPSYTRRLQEYQPSVGSLMT